MIADLAEIVPGPRAALAEQVVRDAMPAVARLLADDLRPAECTIDVRVGSPAQVLVDRAREVSAVLLVVGAHGAFDAASGVGTVASKCVRTSPCPVLLIPKAKRDAFRTVLAGVDFSEVTPRILTQAARIASLDKAKLVVLHVFYGPWHRLHYQAPTPEAPPRFQEQYKAVLERRLAAVSEQIARDAPGIEFETRLFEHPSDGRGITEYAEQHGADLLVLGTRGRGNLRQFLLGSTAERLLRQTARAVLAVPPS